MLFIYDRTTLQGKVKWKIKDDNILSGKDKITYISPGGYSFRDKLGRVICFDFSDSGSNLCLDEGLIVSELYSLDYDFTNDTLKDDGYEELMKEEHRLDLFKNFERFEEIHCFTDVNQEEREVELECVYFELYDPLSEEVLMLVGECDV